VETVTYFYQLDALSPTKSAVMLSSQSVIVYNIYVCILWYMAEKRDKKPKKKNVDSSKQAKKSKKNAESDDEPMEESDDLDEGEEVDYISGSSRSAFVLNLQVFFGAVAVTVLSELCLY